MNGIQNLQKVSDSLAAFRSEALDLLERDIAMTTKDVETDARDEDFWIRVRDAFDINPNLVNFNNGGCAPSPRVVADCLKRQIDYANQSPSIYMWRTLEPQIESVRKRLAVLFGCDAEEVAITRNASESLMTCLFGLPMEAGDEILTSSQDYPRNINGIRQRARREGIKMVQVDVPAVPSTAQELVDSYSRGITDRTKIILVSHVGFMNGQIFPVREICELGRQHGIPVVVDGAHAIAQFPYQREELSCDYYGAALHKWLMAPIGTGMLFVSKPNIESLWALMPVDPSQDGNIRKFEEIGTHQAAIHNAIEEALCFHEILGPDRKVARLRYLRSRWTERAGEHKRIRFHTNLAPEHSCAICTVAVDGIEVGPLASWLEEKHGIVVVPIVHPDFSGLRVSPQVYAKVEEVDRFADALLEAATHGI